ncbi:MAG: hypothetical protein ACRC4X_01115, partial [Cetobacterium sp.]
MDLNATDSLVTEDFATFRSSDFIPISQLTMDPVDLLLHLKQGNQSIKNYVSQFSELMYQIPFYDEIWLKDLFRYGLNEPTRSQLPSGKYDTSLGDYLDCALLCEDSSYTVGIAEGVSIAAGMTVAGQFSATPAAQPKMATAAGRESKMAAAAEREHKMAVAVDREFKMASTSAYPRLVSSLEDQPLLSARTSGLPKPKSAKSAPANAKSAKSAPANAKSAKSAPANAKSAKSAPANAKSAKSAP